mgnify:CR=1 FL=1
MKRLLSSTVARLVMGIFLTQLLSSAAAIALLHSQMLGVIEGNQTRQVLDLRDDLLAIYYNGGAPALEQAVAAKAGSLADPALFAEVSRSGDKIVRSHVAQLAPMAPGVRPVRIKIWHDPKGDPVDALAQSLALEDATHLTVGVVTTPDESFNAAFGEAIGLTVILTGLIALLGALGIGYSISRRTHAIAETADALGRGDFAARIPHDNHGDGFDHLRAQINAMAERIDGLIAQLQSLSASIAHDLRSPVARLRASIEQAISAVPEGESLDALVLARTDAEALQAMLADALELSRLETGAISDRRVGLELAEVAEDLAELYEPLAEQKGIQLERQLVPVAVSADRELLARALSNLIDNAFKYGGHKITVGTAKEPGEAIIWVADDGPGIAESDRATAQLPHARLDNARTRPGAGLGLAVVSAVAKLHGGKLELLSGTHGNGLLARIVLPLK